MDYTVAANFHANSLIDLLKIAYTAYNKDKNNICRAIDLSEKTIVDWYNEIIQAYAPFRSHYILGKKITDENVLAEFLVFAESRTNSHAIEYSTQFLDRILEKWNDGELRKLVGSVDIELVKRFSHNLGAFRDLVFDTKIVMLENGIPKLTGNKDDASVIANWIKDLDKIRSKIRSDTMKILQELECGQEMFNKISNQNNTNNK